MADHDGQNTIFIGDKLPIIFDVALHIHALSPAHDSRKRQFKKSYFLCFKLWNKNYKKCLTMYVAAHNLINNFDQICTFLCNSI